VDPAGELLPADRSGSLEHQMFEYVGQTCLAPAVISGAGPAPDLERGGRRLVIFQQNDL